MKPPVRVKWHQDEGFALNMPDDEWLAIVGPRKWVVLTQDRKFHVIDVEVAAIKQHNVRCFYLPCASDDRWVSLCHFVKRHEKMMQIAHTKGGPFIWELKNNGQFYEVSL